MGVNKTQTPQGIEYAFEDFIERCPVAFHTISPVGTILYANKAELDLLGYAPEDYVGHHLTEFHVDREAIEAILADLACGNTIERVPIRLRVRDGSVKNIEITCIPHSADGKFVHSHCFSVDVTGLTRARAELERKDHVLRQILDSLPVAVYTTDRLGKLTYYNQAATEFAGRKPEIGKDEWSVTGRLFTSERKPIPPAECPMAIALRENRPVRNIEVLAQRSDGTLFPFLPFPTPVRDTDGQLIGAVNTLVDLSETKRMDAAAQRLSAIVESSFDAIVSKDLNSVITTWNRGAERLFGYSADEAVGKLVTMLIPADQYDEEPQILERIRRGERLESYETIRRRKDGTLVPVSLTISPVRNAAGRIVGASKIARDISPAKESEHRIRMLMREVNHRVKNQYAVILSMIRETNKRSENSNVFERLVRARIMALAHSHDLLVSADWKGATIFDLLLAQIDAFGEKDRVSMSGPSVILSPNAVQYLGMAFHELGTNSGQHGVLSGSDGTISVSWEVIESEEQKRFKLVWEEKDGPDVEEIAQKAGFGSVVLKRVAPQAVSGTGDLEFGSHGVTWTLDAPLDCVDASFLKSHAS